MDKLSMSLDEIAATRKKANSQNQRNTGRRNKYRNRRRTSRYTTNRSVPTFKRRRNIRRKDVRKRLKVLNLDTSINNENLLKVFSEYGTVTRCGINYDKMGTSKGSADIEYANHEDAEKAIEKMNNGNINDKVITVEYAKQGSATRRFSGSRNRRRTNLRNNVNNVNRQRNKPIRRFRTIGKRRF